MKKYGRIKVKNYNSDDYGDQYLKGRISSEQFWWWSKNFNNIYLFDPF